MVTSPLSVANNRSLQLFLGVFLLHALTPVATQGDSRWTIPIALNLIHHRTFDLRSYADEVVRNEFYGVECVFPDYRRLYPLTSIEQCGPEGLIYSLYPASVSVFAVPVVAPLERLLWAGGPVLRPLSERIPSPVIQAFLAGDLSRSSPLVEKVVASVYTAGATVVIYRTALAVLGPGSALSHALVFAFGTLAWSLVSRALWHHGPSIFLNAVVVLLLSREKVDRRTGVALGASLAAAFFIRPTNAVPMAVVLVLWVLRLRMPVWWSLAGAVPVACIFFGINMAMYGQAISSYFRVNVPGLSSGAIHGLFLHQAYGEAVLANLVSPARGLFVYMPFLLLLLISSVWTMPMPEFYRRLRPWFATMFGLHLLLVSGYTDWWSGFSYGPRYLSDLLPYLLFLWIPVWKWAEVGGLRRTVLAATLAAAFFVHFRGATTIQVHHWNSTPVSINQDLRRIWSWSDAPFFRGLH